MKLTKDHVKTRTAAALLLAGIVAISGLLALFVENERFGQELHRAMDDLAARSHPLAAPPFFSRPVPVRFRLLPPPTVPRSSS